MRYILLSSLALASCTLLLLRADSCGDALLSEANEGCDDGNKTEGDGCDEVCALEAGFTCPTPGGPCIPDAECGDGIIDGNEDCDDANNSNTDDCINCQNAFCGDGFIQAGAETCEPPGVGDCNEQCQLVCDAPADCQDTDLCSENEDCVGNVCVNTAVDPDDGNQCTSDTCDAATGVNNSPQTDGFDCDEGGARDICLAAVCVASACGDGFIDALAGEVCDDENVINTDACPNDCTPAVCGDGSIEGAESCDDNNASAGDGCDASCQLEGTVIDCGVNAAALQNALNTAPSGSILNVQNGVTCLFTSDVTILDKTLSVFGAGAPAVISVKLTISGTSNLSFQNVRFSQNVETRDTSRALFTNTVFIGNLNNDLLLLKGSSQVGVIASSFTNTNTGLSAGALQCDGTARIVVDRSTFTGNLSEIAVNIRNGCEAIIANTLFVDNNLPTTIRLDKGSLNLINSTFSNSNEVVDSGGNQTDTLLRLDGILGQDVGADPVKANTGTITTANCFIDGEADFGITNINPQLDANFHLPTNSPIRGQGNPTPNANNLVFAPNTIVSGLDIFDHDFDNGPRPQGNPDPGAFEEAQ